MLKKGHVPERTCVLCRKKRSKGELIRLVFKDGGILVDPEQKLGGRGAYLCKDCFSKKDSSKVQIRLKKALRVKVLDGG